MLPVLQEKRQGVTLAILGKDPTSLEIIMVTLVVLGQIRRVLFLEKQAKTTVPVSSLLTRLTALPPNDRCSCVLRLLWPPQIKDKGLLALL